jgi:hypothetical protein
VQRQSGHQRISDGLFVDNWQYTWHTHADGAYMRVRSCIGVIGATGTKHLATGQQLGMNLKADYDLIFCINKGFASHNTYLYLISQEDNGGSWLAIAILYRA